MFINSINRVTFSNFFEGLNNQISLIGTRKKTIAIAVGIFSFVALSYYTYRFCNFKASHPNAEGMNSPCINKFNPTSPQNAKISTPPAEKNAKPIDSEKVGKPDDAPAKETNPIACVENGKPDATPATNTNPTERVEDGKPDAAPANDTTPDVNAPVVSPEITAKNVNDDETDANLNQTKIIFDSNSNIRPFSISLDKTVEDLIQEIYIKTYLPDTAYRIINRGQQLEYHLVCGKTLRECNFDSSVRIERRLTGD